MAFELGNFGAKNRGSPPVRSFRGEFRGDVSGHVQVVGRVPACLFEKVGGLQKSPVRPSLAFDRANGGDQLLGFRIVGALHGQVE